MSNGILYRDAINCNKEAILSYLQNNGSSYTVDICKSYGGEREMVAVRKALNELRVEDKIATDDIVKMWLGKKWSIK